MPTVSLRTFAEADLPVVLPWFAHPDQREFAHDMPVRELTLMQTMPGTEHRGALVLARHAWVADDERATAVAFLGAEVYDRPPYPHAGVCGTMAGLTLCVDPARWSRGYGRAALRALATAAELDGVRWWLAGIAAHAAASARCAAAAGFRAQSDEPDEEGMRYWLAAGPLRAR
jgi:L-amino acid N-acyltransferase YncA